MMTCHSGAGIGGLALAVTIGKFSEHIIDIYEAENNISTIGAGIAMWKRTRQAMASMGLEEKLSQKEPFGEMSAVNPDQRLTRL
jgi:salicylate hydroxylase